LAMRHSQACRRIERLGRRRLRVPQRLSET
jgi:hypothetical protein